MKISSRVGILPGSRIRETLGAVDELKSRGVDVIEMHIGQPGLPPAQSMLKEFSEQLIRDSFDMSSYTPTPGIRQLREAIVEDYRKYSGIKLEPDNVVVTTGSSEAIIGLAMTLVEPGTNVVMVNPTYLLYKPTYEFFGAKVNEVRVGIENGFNPSEEDLKMAVNRDTRAIILVSPDNPTGAVLREEVIKTAVDLAVDNDIFLIYDEAYKHLYYEGQHVYALKYDAEHVIAMDTFSKDPAMPGWRLGYVLMPKEFAATFSKVKQYININPPTPAQYLAVLYLRKYKDQYIKEVLPVYKERLNSVYEAIRSYLPDASVMKPKAGLFIFPNLDKYLGRLGLNDESFAQRLLREKHVGVVPGSAFGDAGRNHVRINFAKESPDRLIRGIKLMAEFLTHT
ncbi:aspartate aminotransferase [Thermocladium modestius]|uniref:Aspartate aminotransferase n=1 Tax=Thermocladium modestius TaxID=62609 RepID=A0A830GUJ3_9CREN|nr:pyridoxal phosphate-dependent aminotransferase [Thermocladium modestius]GGP19866.1 aspartate aminotransferase [Thermocladium modestius]